MIDSSLFSKIKKIQIKTSKAVTEIFSGEYRSVFKGQGMEFEEVREYLPGDDIRSIDWNVTARMQKPFVKQFKEERELTVFFIADMSSSMNFGSKQKSKRELMAELCSVLAFTAILNNDKVGLILFSDDIEHYIPPKKGKRHVLRVVREILSHTLEKKAEHRKQTRINDALEYFIRVQRKRCICFLMSDFFDDGYQKTLQITSKKHDLAAIQIDDPLEYQIPRSGLLLLEDLENAQTVNIDFSNQKSIETFKAYQENNQLKLKNSMRQSGIDFLNIKTNDDIVKKLTLFFKEREKRVKQ